MGHFIKQLVCMQQGNKVIIDQLDYSYVEYLPQLHLKHRSGHLFQKKKRHPGTILDQIKWFRAHD